MLSNCDLPLVLAITGASGVIYGLRTLQFLLDAGVKVDLVISDGALQVMQEEMKLDLRVDLKNKLTAYLNEGVEPANWSFSIHNILDYGAPIASGSYRTQGMAIIPCSIGTLGALANGLTNNLIHRAAACCLKERRKLVVVVREMPFGHIQLKNMLALSEAGAVVACASPGFYHQPQTISDQINFVVGRVLDQFGFDHQLFQRWKERAMMRWSS